MSALAAIQYAAEGFDPRVGKLMGRQIAGQTFLEAWIHYSGADPLTSWTNNNEQRDLFITHARELGASGPIVSAQATDLDPLKAAGALWLDDPSVARYAWARRWHSQNAWSVVGITHTICTHAAMDRIVELVRAPIQPWDALICTSNAAKQAVSTVVQAEMEYLHARMGAHAFTIPMLPVIPLGVPCDRLQHDPNARKRWRDELGLGDDDIAVLQFGRLALHGKAHPSPLYLALMEASRRLGRKLHLILAGQFPHPRQEELYRGPAASVSHAVTTHFVDGARADAGEIRSAADIGTLLSDNIQETFGLAPVELMAAGLPVVVSDWDGLKDTVEQGTTGFRVETLIPRPGAGELLAWRYATFDGLDPFLGGVVQSTAVDIGQAADAFEALAGDPALRQRMGEAGRLRARTHFDWPVIIGAYRNLLAELEAARKTSQDVSVARSGLSPAEPARMDPFTTFAGYASNPITQNMMIKAVPLSGSSVANVLGGQEMAVLNRAALLSKGDLDLLVKQLDNGPMTVSALCEVLPHVSRRKILLGVGWLLKFGYAARA